MDNPVEVEVLKAMHNVAEVIQDKAEGQRKGRGGGEDGTLVGVLHDEVETVLLRVINHLKHAADVAVVQFLHHRDAVLDLGEGVCEIMIDGFRTNIKPLSEHSILSPIASFETVSSFA